MQRHFAAEPPALEKENYTSFLFLFWHAATRRTRCRLSKQTDRSVYVRIHTHAHTHIWARVFLRAHFTTALRDTWRTLFCVRLAWRVKLRKKETARISRAPPEFNKRNERRVEVNGGTKHIALLELCNIVEA